MTVTDRFLKYVSYPTMSEEESQATPSTEKQLLLAEQLKLELLDLGLEDATVDKYGYVYAHLEANTEETLPVIGFIAHMDTSSEAKDSVIKPRIIEYYGGDILLNETLGIRLSASDYPELSSFVGQRLIVTDGTTLLGADDKAGIAEIITMLEVLKNKDVLHGKIAVAFTPDEEIGRGADHFDVELFGADFAYTVDGGILGELEYENFNAATARITVKGRAIHSGSAKGKMINAARIAAELDSLLPGGELPELTEGYEGFHHMLSISGDTEEATVKYIIRDHDMAKFERKKADFVRVAAELNKKYGGGVVLLELTDSYYNMREMIEPNIHIVKRAERAMLSLGVTPKISPIRGGTDGARLSFMGLPCPNISTGGMNFHSRFEYVSIDAMEKMTEVLCRIANAELD